MGKIIPELTIEEIKITQMLDPKV
uniref:Uncharacterized protein n=1 Tax=Rhizophora mucronata TaxID=61149 RepID=A0A2P2NIE8_RHIMU